ncbi:MAG: galactose-1-phosphate uridylyltransferase [Verrucomicrobiota bacterium]
MDKTEMRLDPLTEAWTIFSEARAARPAFGSVQREAMESPVPDPFLAGLERFSSHTLHQTPGPLGWQVRVVPNRAPVLRVEGDPTRHGDGFYDRMDGVGAHEVIVEDPGRRALEDLSLGEIAQVIQAWKLRMLDLMRDPRMRSFSILKNVGQAAGGSLHHSVSQLVAMAVIYPLLKRKLETARAFYELKKRSIFEDILSEEVRTASRLVYENNGFAVFCPYAARTPFEMAIYPKRQCPDFHGLSDQELAQFADVLRMALRKLARALNHPAYNLMLFTAPTRTARHDHWTSIERDFRWHVEIVPRLDHLGGLELGTGCWVNSVWPEVAADYLRNAEVRE